MRSCGAVISTAVLRRFRVERRALGLRSSVMASLFWGACEDRL
jgi:hypothetical protein